MLWTRGIAARETLSYLDRRGINAQPALLGAGLSRRQLSRDDIGLSVGSQYRFLELAAAEANDSLLGLHVAAEMDMWIFAAYELLRTWRSRSKSVCKLVENGGLDLKIETFERKRGGYLDMGREIQIRQLYKIRADPALMDEINIDLRVTKIPFVRLEHIRVALAKHEFRGRESSTAETAGYGRINQWCGSLD